MMFTHSHTLIHTPTQTQLSPSHTHSHTHCLTHTLSLSHRHYTRTHTLTHTHSLCGICTSESNTCHAARHAACARCATARQVASLPRRRGAAVCGSRLSLLWPPPPYATRTIATRSRSCAQPHGVRLANSERRRCVQASSTGRHNTATSLSSKPLFVSEAICGLRASRRCWRGSVVAAVWQRGVGSDGCARRRAATPP